ncbi:MAG: hypothetical protein ACXV5U_13170 [Ilumatobacteraceae bacterium]
MRPPTLVDGRGLAISTDSAAAAASYVRGVELLLLASSDAELVLCDSVGADPRFAMAWIALAIVLAETGDQRESAQCAESAAARMAAISRRERQHIEVIRLLLSGNRQRAAVLGREHMLEYPTDAVVAHVLALRGLS